jgi:hypothetical protein
MRKVTLVMLALGCTTAAGAQTVGQSDDFEGTKENWIINGGGFGAPSFGVTPKLFNGPTGMYLLLRSIAGSGAGSRLAVLNGSQWAGDYTTSGIDAISMDVRNFSATDLFLRLAFEDPAGGPPTNVAFSSNAIVLPAHSAWMNIIFPILPGSLTAGLGTVNGALANTTVLRLYNSQASNFPNPVTPISALTAELGVDNITALATVPEPSSIALLGAGLLALGLAARRREDA